MDSKIKKTKKNKDLGLKVSGTATNQKVTISREDSLAEIFGTQYPEIANALLSHCMNVLKGDEASDEYPAYDQRGFMMAAVAEMKPRDTVERMLSVQMAATHVALIRTGRRFALADALSSRCSKRKSYYTSFYRR